MGFQTMLTRVRINSTNFIQFNYVSLLNTKSYLLSHAKLTENIPQNFIGSDLPIWRKSLRWPNVRMTCALRKIN